MPPAADTSPLRFSIGGGRHPEHPITRPAPPPSGPEEAADVCFAVPARDWSKQTSVERAQAGHPSRPWGIADHALIDACVQGDAAAWGRFVDCYGRLVYNIPHRLGLAPDACDDVFQSTFAVILRELPNVRDRSSLPKWLMTIAHHESCRWLRQHRRPGRVPPPSGSATLEPADEDLQHLELRHLVHEAFEQLDARCRELLGALFLSPSEPAYQEVSQRLNMPVGAIGPTRSRCLKKLLALLGDALD
jgi:RNA polymerase sigma factor (sigma-70 family)